MTYEIINIETTNTLASYDSPEEARTALETIRGRHPSLREDLAVVVSDDEGIAQGFLEEGPLPEERAPNASPGLVR